MASNASSLTTLLTFAVFLLFGLTSAQLKFGFYNHVCPEAEAIVFKEMAEVIFEAPSLAGPLLRLQYHDCFVRGCDASVLLNPSAANNPTEKVTIPNQTIRGFGVIDRIKAKLEVACPGIVSCADVITLVARDAVALVVTSRFDFEATHGPHFQVETGRRDGTISLAQDVIGNLVPPTSNITTLKAAFRKKGLNVKDMVVLSGAHTIGTSHCSAFSSRLYNATGKGDVDPTLDKRYVERLKGKCRPNDNATLVEMDPGSFRTFDTGYFKQVAKRRSLFLSDEALLHDEETRAYVECQAKATPEEFFGDFAESMVKMGRIEVLTGKEGEIRKVCGSVN